MLSTLRDLARVLGCGDHQAEDVVREERSARAALSRRGLFRAAGAVAAGSLLVPGVLDPVAPINMVFGYYGYYTEGGVDLGRDSGCVLLVGQRDAKMNGIWYITDGRLVRAQLGEPFMVVG